MSRPSDESNKAQLVGLRSGLQCVYPHQPRYGIEACALYNGVGGFDDHAGIAMPAQWYPVH